MHNAKILDDNEALALARERNERFSTGKATLNELRREAGLPEIKNETFDKHFIEDSNLYIESEVNIVAIIEKKTHEEHLEMAKEIVDGFANMSMGHREAESVLRLAQEKLRSRRSDEIISPKTPQEGDIRERQTVSHNNIYEEITKFAEREKEEAAKAIQTEENQVCIKADSYIAKEIKYQTALLHQIFERLNKLSLPEKKGNKRPSLPFN